MRLLPIDQFAHVFQPLKGLRVGVVDGVGNVGDWLLYQATRQMLDSFGIDWVSINLASGDDPKRQGVEHLALFAGGNVGYHPCTAIRRLAYKTGIPSTLLPQTWITPFDSPYLSPEEIQSDRIFARDQTSLKLCPKATFCHDLALGFDFPEPPEKRPNGFGLFLRRSGHAKFSDLSIHDPAETQHTVAAYAELAGKFEHVATDRLHFAITALGMGCKVTLLPVAYHKNRSVYECSLKALGVEWADHPDQVRR